MKFTVSSSVLLKQLAAINGVVSTNPIVPILENFLFKLENQYLEFNVKPSPNQGVICKINKAENALEAQFILKTDADDIDEIILEIYKDNKKLLDIHNYDFEKVVRRLFFSLGYDVFPTKRTRDGGYDMLLKREDPVIPTEHLVECKSTKKNKRIGIDIVERFLYKIDEMKVSSGVLVTNFEFSLDVIKKYACKFFNSKLQLIDGKKIMSMITNFTLRFFPSLALN